MSLSNSLRCYFLVHFDVTSVSLSNSLRLHFQIHFRIHVDSTFECTSCLLSMSLRFHFQIHFGVTFAFTSSSLRCNFRIHFDCTSIAHTQHTYPNCTHPAHILDQTSLLTIVGQAHVFGKLLIFLPTCKSWACSRLSC